MSIITSRNDLMAQVRKIRASGRIFELCALEGEGSPFASLVDKPDSPSSLFRESVAAIMKGLIQKAPFKHIGGWNNLLVSVPRGGLIPDLTAIGDTPVQHFECKRVVYSEEEYRLHGYKPRANSSARKDDKFVLIFYKGDIPSANGEGFGLWDGCGATFLTSLATIRYACKKRGIKKDFSNVVVMTTVITPDAIVCADQMFPGIRFATGFLGGRLNKDRYIVVGQQLFDWLASGCEGTRPEEPEGEPFVSLVGDFGNRLTGVSLKSNLDAVQAGQPGILCRPSVIQDGEHIIQTEVGEITDIEYIAHT